MIKYLFNKIKKQYLLIQFVIKCLIYVNQCQNIANF